MGASSKREVVTMEYLACSRCSTLIQGNSTKMCLKCVRSELDITASIPKMAKISYCPECDTYKHLDLVSSVESKLQNNQLLSFLVNNLFTSSSSSLRLLHSEFIWTNSNTKSEPKIIKVKLVVEKDNPITGSTSQQECTVEYRMFENMCGPCLRAHVDPQEWIGRVVLHCRSALESIIDIQGLMADHNAIRGEPEEESNGGFALFFDRQEDARGLQEHLCSSKTLMTRILHENEFQFKTNLSVSYKYSVTIEICPVSQGDLIRRSRSGGLRICSKVSRKGMKLLDPFNFSVEKLGRAEYWESPFEPQLRTNELVEYVVLEVGKICYQTTLWTIVRNVRVALVSDYGKNDTVFYAKTHLLHNLVPGVHMLGYHLIEKYRGGGVGVHVVLIKRSGTEENERVHIHDKSSCDDSMDSSRG